MVRDDDFFGEDPFESIINNFFGGKTRGIRRHSSSGLGNNDFIETKKSIFLILDLSSHKEVDVTTGFDETDKVLEINADNSKMRYVLPNGIKIKGFEWNFNNGILEVSFRK